jgi:hypothetical protein
MKIDKARLAAGDRNELLKLARSIRPSTPFSKTTNPIASQFFGDNGTEIRHLPLDQLTENLAGADFNEHIKWIEALSAAGYDERMKLLRPEVAGDVSQIGSGGRSGWTPPQNVTVSTTAGKVATTVQFKKAAKATEVSAADTGVLVESLKAIVYQLLGVSAETFDPNTLKVKLTQALKAARPDVRTRLAKALGTAA